jgi:hypothetical protein
MGMNREAGEHRSVDEGKRKAETRGERRGEDGRGDEPGPQMFEMEKKRCRKTEGKEEQ